MWNLVTWVLGRRSHRAALEADLCAWLDRSAFDAERARNVSIARR